MTDCGVVERRAADKTEDSFDCSDYDGGRIADGSHLTSLHEAGSRLHCHRVRMASAAAASVVIDCDEKQRTHLRIAPPRLSEHCD